MCSNDDDDDDDYDDGNGEDGFISHSFAHLVCFGSVRALGVYVCVLEFLPARQVNDVFGQLKSQRGS